MESQIRQPLLPDDPMYQQAVGAMKKYDQAKADGRPQAELEKLRLEAEYAFQSVSDYQLEALRGLAPTRDQQRTEPSNVATEREPSHESD